MLSSRTSRYLLFAIIATSLLAFPLLLSRETKGAEVSDSQWQAVYTEEDALRLSLEEKEYHFQPVQWGGSCGPNGCPPSGGGGYVQTYPYSQPVNSAPPSSTLSAPSESDVIVRCSDQGSNYTDVGSGTVVANDDKGNSYVLTNFHVIRKGDTGNSIHSIYSIEQPAKQAQYSNCTYVDSEPNNDLAIIRVPATLRPVRIIYNPNTQETFASVGFRSGRFYRIPQRVVGKASFRNGDPGSLLTLSNGIVSGQSGGAVYDSQGNLVAVNWGSTGDSASAVWGGPLRRLIQRCCRVPGVQVNTVPPSINPPQADIHSPTPPVPPPISEDSPPCNSCNCDPSKIATIEAELAKLSAQLASLDTSSFVTKTDLETRINSLQLELTTIHTDISSINKSLTEINVAVASLCQPTPPPPTPVPDDPQPTPADDPLPVPDSRILYFTSTKGCPACSPVDAKVRSLKLKGYPITVIDLDPTQTVVEGVPRLFIPDKDKTVQGIANIEVYLALLTPQ